MAASPKHAARVLGLTGDVTLDDVKRVRRKMALKYHPDRCADVVQATRHMARINAAADTLIAFLKNKPQPQAKRPRPDFTKAKTRATSARAEPKRQQPKPESTREEPRSQASEAAFQAQRKLVETAAKSYQQVLNQIGQQSIRRSIDLKIMRFGTAA